MRHGCRVLYGRHPCRIVRHGQMLSDGEITYWELDGRVTVTADRIRELGFGVGDRIALYLPKDGRYLVLLLALIRAGCAACPLSTRLPPQGVASLLKKVGCRALISSDEAILGATDTAVRKLPPETLLVEAPVARDRTQSSGPLQLALDLPATIVFTSGSVGEAKAALHTFGNHYFSALGSNANI